jgi:hypothetical protein
MPTIIPNSRTILSVYPIAVEHYARHNGLITYQHPAAKRDAIIVREYNPERMSTSNPGRVPATEPLFRDHESPCEVNQGHTLIRLYDTFTWSRDFTQDGERFIPHPLSALEVARTLVTAWASDVVEGNGNMGPGVTVIAGDVPTAEELAEVRRRQTAYALALINSATVMYAKQEVKNISDLHRSMALWLGANNLPWVPKIEQVELKACRACGEQIRAQALVCKECGVDLVDFYVKHDLIPEKLEDPAAFAFLENRITAKKASKAA